MKPYSFLFESFGNNGNSSNNSIVYHYEKNDCVCKSILKSGRLISASFIGNEDNKYGSRSVKYGGNLDKYFKDRYDRFYKGVLKKEYCGDYGVYFSPTDMFRYSLKLDYLQKFRFKLNVGLLLKCGYDVIWQVGKLGPYNKKILKKVNSVNEYVGLYNDYLSKIESEQKEVKIAIEDNVNSNKLLFLRLPQVIVFAGKDGIVVKNGNFERKL